MEYKRCPKRRSLDSALSLSKKRNYLPFGGNRCPNFLAAFLPKKTEGNRCSTMSTRSQGVAALRRSRDAVKAFLKKHIDNSKKIVENPQEGDSFKTLPKHALRQAKANLIQRSATM